MSSVSALNLSVRPSLARVGVVGVFAVLLVGLGFLVPFWVVLTTGTGSAAGLAVARKWRQASSTVDRILAEELR